MSSPVQPTSPAEVPEMPVSLSEKNNPSVTASASASTPGKTVKKAKSIRLLLLEARLERIRLLKALCSLNP
jgi:hypothetical protein